ncbi:MAG: hypothetical protein ABR512_10490 [Desulfopila sp.]
MKHIKMHIPSSSLIVFICLLMTTPFIAAAQETPPTVRDAAVTPVKHGADVNRLVFTGTIRKAAAGTALLTGSGTYLLQGVNLEEIVGSRVNIIGTIIRRGDVKTIEVVRAQLLPE